MNRLIVIAILIMLGKASGFFKDLLLTFYLGVSQVTDAFFLASSISSLAFAAVSSSIPLVIVPVYSRWLSEGLVGRILARRLGAVVLIYLIVASIIALLLLAFSDTLVAALSEGGDLVVATRASDLLMIMAFTFVFSAYVISCNAVQTVRGVSTPSYIIPLVNNTLFCIGIAFFHTPDNFNLVLWAGVVGWIFLAVWNGWSTRASFAFQIEGFSQCVRGLGVSALVFASICALYVEQINSYVAIYFSSHLAEGSISVVSYATKLNLLVTSVFVVVLTTSIFPRLAKLVSGGGENDLAAYLAFCVRIVVVFSIGASVFFVIFADPMVALLFGRGAFTDDNATDVARVFAVIVCSLPFILVRELLSRVLYSQGAVWQVVAISSVSLLVNAALCFYLFDRFDVVGVAIALSVSSVVNCILVFYVLERQQRFSLLTAVAVAVGVSGVASVSASVFILTLGQYGVPWLLAAFSYLGTFAVAVLFMPLPESRALLRWFGRYTI